MNLLVALPCIEGWYGSNCTPVQNRPVTGKVEAVPLKIIDVDKPRNVRCYSSNLWTGSSNQGVDASGDED